MCLDEPHDTLVQISWAALQHCVDAQSRAAVGRCASHLEGFHFSLGHLRKGVHWKEVMVGPRQVGRRHKGEPADVAAAWQLHHTPSAPAEVHQHTEQLSVSLTKTAFAEM